MSIFGGLFQKRQQADANPIRDLLFGDLPLDEWPPEGADSETFPWSAFVAARSHLGAGDRDEAVACWRQILADSALESRHHLQAWHFLRQQGERPAAAVAKQVLGVVIEVAMPKGLDLLAAYSDHSARYYNYSGAAVIWEHPNSSLDAAIDEVFEAARRVVSQIGPWEQPRPAPPPRDHARLSFLTPGGSHFGQGPMTALSRDPLGERVLETGTALMRALAAR